MPANMKRVACCPKRFTVVRQKVVNTKQAGGGCTMGRKAKASAVAASNDSRPVTRCFRALQRLLVSIRGSEEIPRDLRRMMQALAKASVKANRGRLSITLGERRHFVENEPVRELEHMLDDIDRKLKGDVRARQAIVDGASTDKFSRETALAAAISRLAELRGVVGELTVASKAARKAFVEAQGIVEGAIKTHSALGEELKSWHSKRAQLQSIEKNTVVPLQLSQMKPGSAGQKRLKVLQKAGKQYGFHDALLTSLPLIFKKHPDRRVTFDGIVMQSLENEFQKRLAAFDEKIATVQARLQEQAITTERAKSALALADERCRASERACADAQVAAKAGLQASVECKKRVQLFAKDRADSRRTLKKAQMKLQKFHGGPLASFVKLKTALPARLPVVGGDDSASEDRDTDTHTDTNSSPKKLRRLVQ